MEYSKLTNPVTFPSGCIRLSTNPAPTGSRTCAKTIGIIRVWLLHRDQCRQPPVHDDFRLERDKFSGVTFHDGRIPGGPSIVVGNIATMDPTEFLHPFAERCHSRLSFAILLRKVHEYTNATALTLLRAGPERPRNRPAAEQRDELASSHAGHGRSLPPR